MVALVFNSNHLTTLINEIMMYAAKIKINYQPELIPYKKRVTVWDGYLTLEIVSKYVSTGERFYVETQDGGMYSDTYILEIHGKRPETQNELTERIAKQEKYNKNYDLFHAKKKTI